MQTRLFLLPVFFCPWLAVVACGQSAASTQPKAAVIATLKPTILAEARWAMAQPPVTVTAQTSPRSAGGKHDFFSEGDYWWPDSANPQGPYVQRDGMTNPDNFVAHRQDMIRFSRIVGALASAYVVTRDESYVRQAFRHLNAWFVDSATRMNPSLLYAQAIKGRATGRGIGIIDTIHLMEVAQGLRVLETAKSSDRRAVAAIRQWFADYLRWLTTHPYGKDEMNAKNNHGTCWVMQVAAFARLTKNDSLLDVCRNRYKTVLLPDQMATDGSFPQELRRTKPYGYSLFNLDAMTMICQILSTPTTNLWAYQTTDGRGIRKGIEYLYPFVQNKASWPLKPDVMYWNDWPVAHPFLVVGAVAFGQTNWLTTWKKLDHHPQVDEVVRNLPIRNPVIWL
ncbi:alginate lyase family protein [Larkinella knui]|uniref:Alginate lyase n=1 Tax=Larkinella knui TaxID=2025310 RepID=A0A3P1CQE3_9BACT|nr:alginate lyase family protein [Larkinella knui]RRB15479.1 alginate lyase [Larkinella knui]